MPLTDLPTELKVRIVQHAVMDVNFAGKQTPIDMHDVPAEASRLIEPLRANTELARLAHGQFFQANVIECSTVTKRAWGNEILPFSAWSSNQNHHVLSAARNILFCFEIRDEDSDANDSDSSFDSLSYILNEFIPNIKVLVPNLRSVEAQFDCVPKVRRPSDAWVSENVTIIQETVPEIILSLQREKLPLKAVLAPKTHWGGPAPRYTISHPLTEVEATELARNMAGVYKQGAGEEAQRELEIAEDIERERELAEAEEWYD